MGLSFQECERNLHKLATWFMNSGTHTRNEATTRLQIINRLLTECLGWDLDDCKAEERLEKTYIDYSLYCPECLLIVEAKKEGTYFELPVGTASLNHEISYFFKHTKDVGDAIQQAQGYCQERGTPYGIVCNGHQIVAFIGSRNDGRPPIEGQALVFDSFDTMEKNFLKLWQNLSKDGVNNKRLSLELRDTISAPPPDKLSTYVTGYPGFKQRNSLQTDLQILADLFIEDLARISEEGDEKDFLKECYCKSGALSQYALISKDLLRIRYSGLFQTITEGPTLSDATTKKGLNPELVAQSLSRRPILLIGDVGVGKTTFIKNLYQVDAEDTFRDAIALYIDFGSEPTLEKDIELFVSESIEHQLAEKYNINIRERNFMFGVLHRDIEHFEAGPYADIKDTLPDLFRSKRLEFIEEKTKNKDEYLKKCLNHIQKGHKKQIVIFLDNVDQRQEELQEKVFIVGQTMADKWSVTVFISLRPQTFYKSRVSGALAAYHPRAFTIAPPRVDEVISKRLRYGIKLLERGIQIGFTGAILLKVESLTDYLKILIDSFDKNKHLVEFLDNMCGGNVRLALQFVRAFISSGHVDTAKILRIFRETGFYLVPLHEFLRAVIYADHEHYSPSSSPILNVFDISSPDGKEHFLMPIMLSQLGRLSHVNPDGFVPISDIFSYLQGIGFTPNQIRWALERTLRFGLIETPVKTNDEKRDIRIAHYRITTVGAYYIQKLITRFTYIDAMIVDTPIVSNDMRSHITEAYYIADRLVRAKIFCDYLDQQWSIFKDHGMPFDWQRIRVLIDYDISYITGKIQIREDIVVSQVN